MKAYVATTGVLFGLLTVAHVWRIIVEPRLARDPWFLPFTVVAAALGLWACRLMWGRPGAPRREGVHSSA